MKKPNPKKDELLNQILQEISDENSELNNSYYEKPSQDDNKKTSSTGNNIRNIIIGIIVILIIFMLLNPTQKTNKVVPNNTKIDKSTLPKENQLYKEKKHTEVKTEKKENLDTKVQGKKTVEIIITEAEEVNTQEEEILIPQDPETERERAKRMLMEQMQN